MGRGAQHPRVVGIDPETNRVVRTLDLEPDCRPGITAAAELLWLRGCLYRGGDVIDARTLEPVGTRRDVPEWFGALGSQLVVDDRVWLAEWRPHRELITQLVAVDLESLTVVDQYEIEVRVPAAVVAFDSLWFASGPTILRLPASALHEE